MHELSRIITNWAESWPWYRPVGDYPGIGFWREIQMSCLLGTCIHYFKTVKSWSSSIIMSWYDPWPRAHKKYTAFGLHGPALGLDLSVYGLGLVHAGLRRYIFRDPSARGRIISHCPLGKRYFRVIKSMQWIVEILNLLQSSSLVVSFLVSSLVQTYYQ